jgi:hypothetical protein
MLLKLELFPSSGERSDSVLGPLEGTNLNHWTRLVLSKGPMTVSLPIISGRKLIMFPTLYLFVSRIRDDGRSPKDVNSECCTSSEIIQDLRHIHVCPYASHFY